MMLDKITEKWLRDNKACEQDFIWFLNKATKSIEGEGLYLDINLENLNMILKLDPTYGPKSKLVFILYHLDEAAYYDYDEIQDANINKCSKERKEAEEQKVEHTCTCYESGLKWLENWFKNYIVKLEKEKENEAR